VIQARRVSGIKILCLLGSLTLGVMAPSKAFARPGNSHVTFGAGRGVTFYTSPQLSTINERLGNSPRLTVDNEFGRALTNQATYENSNPTDTLNWGVELQQWGETHRGAATTAEENPRSEATLAFVRLWLTGGVRLWPWVGPIVVQRNTNFLGHAVQMAKARALGPGFYSWLRFATGPLLWRHDYLLSDDVNQTAIDYASRTAAWEGGLRWTAGWRLGHFCDLGLDISASKSVALKSENIVGQSYLSGRDNSDSSSTLGVDTLAKAKWQSMQTLIFVRFFYP